MNTVTQATAEAGNQATAEASLSEPKPHPLLSRLIRPIRDWREFLECWQTAGTYQEMLGLLHVGWDIDLSTHAFGEKQYERVDKIKFYLEIADGWQDKSYLCTKKECYESEPEFAVGWDAYQNRIMKGVSDLRVDLARKAFEVLCVNFFKIELDTNSRTELCGQFAQKVSGVEGLRLVQGFLKPTQDLFAKLRVQNLLRRNEDPVNSHKYVLSFVQQLLNFLWTWKEEDTKYVGSNQKEKIEQRNSEMGGWIEQAKPWMIELLSHLGKLTTLRPWIYCLGNPALRKLEEIAMRSRLGRFEHSVGRDRLVMNLDEACFVGSHAAWLLKEHELKLREHERLSAICSAERQAKDAAEKIARLSGK